MELGATRTAQMPVITQEFCIVLVGWLHIAFGWIYLYRYRMIYIYTVDMNSDRDGKTLI